MSSIDLAKFDQMKATGDLPSPKGPALAILRLTQKEDVSLADLVHAVKADPAFVGRLIRAANALQGIGQRPIVAVREAMMVLGIPAVRSLALGFSLLANHKHGKCRNFDYGRFWSRSLVCAAALQALTLHTRASSPEDCFSVGLLCHVGELALATIFPEDYSTLLGKAESASPAGLIEEEQKRFAMNHSELTAAMMLDWGMPKVFSDPVFHHERPEEGDFVEGSRPYVLLWSLVLTERIADICMAGDADRRAMIPQMLMLGSKLSIDADTLTALCNRVAKEWKEWAAMLDVEANEMPPFEELSKAPPPPQITDGNLRAGGEDGYRMRLLVVDDDASIRGLLKTLLVNAGHEVFDAADGRRGLELALELRPQIMIVDWMMPEMDGIELIRSLRKTKIGQGIYVLILTGMETDEKLIEAFESGADDFMNKPLKPRVLAARLRAGQRVVKLQQELERDREEIRRFAAELAITNRRLREAALTDVLTGFPNRRHAMERLDQEWALSSRNKRPLACMVIDVDEFKQINDTHGHDVGDAMLRQAADALKAGLRAQDVVARIGGDEFLVICPDTALDAALACAERVRLSVSSTPVVAGTLQLKASVSIGVAMRDSGMANADALVKRADQGVYIAKQKGRNRIGVVQAPGA